MRVGIRVPGGFSGVVYPVGRLVTGLSFVAIGPTLVQTGRGSSERWGVRGNGSEEATLLIPLAEHEEAGLLYDDVWKKRLKLGR